MGHNVGLQTKLIAAFHSSATGGHSGVLATYQRVKRLFYWLRLKVDVETCETVPSLQKAKHEHCRYPGPLQLLPIPQNSWQDISMDFIEGFAQVQWLFSHTCGS